jgi:hypothetical protein
MRVLNGKLFVWGTVFLAALTACPVAKAQLYKNSKAPLQARVKDLLAQMTLEEKIGQMSMGSLKGSLDNKIAFGFVESPFVTVNEIASQSIKAKAYAREKHATGHTTYTNWRGFARAAGGRCNHISAGYCAGQHLEPGAHQSNGVGYRL